MCAIFPITLFGIAAFDFFRRMKGCSLLWGESSPRRTISLFSRLGDVSFAHGLVLPWGHSASWELTPSLYCFVFWLLVGPCLFVFSTSCWWGSAQSKIAFTMLRMMALYITRRLCFHGLVYCLCNSAPHCIFHLGFFPCLLLCFKYGALHLCALAFCGVSTPSSLRTAFVAFFALVTSRCAVVWDSESSIRSLEAFLGWAKHGFWAIFGQFLGFPFPPLGSCTSGRICVALY